MNTINEANNKVTIFKNNDLDSINNRLYEVREHVTSLVQNNSSKEELNAVVEKLRKVKQDIYSITIEFKDKQWRLENFRDASVIDILKNHHAPGMLTSCVQCLSAVVDLDTGRSRQHALEKLQRTLEDLKDCEDGCDQLEEVLRNQSQFSKALEGSDAKLSTLKTQIQNILYSQHMQNFMEESTSMASGWLRSNGQENFGNAFAAASALVINQTRQTGLPGEQSMQPESVLFTSMSAMASDWFRSRGQDNVSNVFDAAAALCNNRSDPGESSGECGCLQASESNAGDGIVNQQLP